MSIFVPCLWHALLAGSPEGSSEESSGHVTESPDKFRRSVWRAWTCWEINLRNLKKSVTLGIRTTTLMIVSTVDSPEWTAHYVERRGLVQGRLSTC